MNQQDLIDNAVTRLREASRMSEKLYHKPLILTFSGGKDSSVCLELARMAGVPFEVLHSHTTADAPETVYFVRNQFRELEASGIPCEIHYPVFKGKRTSMWQLIPEKMIPPTRIARYCCAVLKEGGGRGRFVITGVRWAESTRRRAQRGIYETENRFKDRRIILNNDNDEKRMLFETCKPRAKRIVNPIIDWEDRDVWDFIRSEHIRVNCLYDEGFDRVGCIGCPMARKRRYAEFQRWPAYKQMYLRAFDRMLERRKASGRTTGSWETAEDVFSWWMDEEQQLPGQMSMEEYESEEEDTE